MVQFTDAKEMARQHDFFQAPTMDDLKGVGVGSSVKVCSGRERFWVLVSKIEGDVITGVVDNDLVCEEHGLKCGDEIMFDKRHIYIVMPNI